MQRARWLRASGALAAVALAAIGPGSAGARPAGDGLRPVDYTKVKGLSRPVFDAVVETSEMVEMADGTHLYVEITRPDPERYGKRRWPVIMEISPYHGTLADREGTRIFPDPKDEQGNPIGLTGYFAPRGYAVVMVDLRGTGRSEGCLDHLGPNDASDMKTVIEWAARQPWSNGKVGLTGHSYVGSTPSIAAAQKPKGLVTIVPSAGLASMYDHQFQHGVPYYLQWAGPIFAYEQLALERDLPPPLGTGDNPNGPNPQTGCGLVNSSATAGSGQVTGQYEQWHRERDHRKGATAAKIPIFIVHGVNDNAARIPAAEWFFGRRFDRSGDKVWIGQWDHGSSGNTSCPGGAHPNCRFLQWQYVLHAWFDKHLQGRDVDTGPAVEAFLNDGLVWTADSWSKPKRYLKLLPDAGDGSLAPRPGEPASATFTSYPTGPRSTSGSVEFVSEPLKSDTILVGLPQAQLNVSLATAQSLDLIVTILREEADGDRFPMTYCAIQPLLREGIDTVTPVIPGEEMALRPQCFTMAHHIGRGDKIVYQVSTSSPHHVAMHPVEALVTVFTGEDKSAIRLPVVTGRLYPDVPHERPAP